MARCLPPSYISVSLPSLADKLRELADMIEGRDPLIKSAERYYTTGEWGELLTVIHLEIKERPE
ncbi:hypothetical protein CIL06_21340 [Pantoea vagans]|nr:hypothetical protein CIL06_21340 [Pantoea vagans]